MSDKGDFLRFLHRYGGVFHANVIIAGRTRLNVRNNKRELPIYEYEPDDRECLICDGRTEAIQGINDAPLKFCPTCGLEVRRVISRASFQIQKGVAAEKAADKGFTTYKRAEKGKWEKVGGHGPDMIVGSKEDMAAVEAEKTPAKKVIDLSDT